MQTKTLRIIGGKWRGRKISFIPLKGIRPTTNVTRETIFNWLAPVIVGANCLDLFAGSGALGFEALSRGAKHLVMVDNNPKVVSKLKENTRLLQANNVDFCLAQLPKRLGKIPKQSFDIVFLDPPFYHNLIQPTCEKLLHSDYLAKHCLIYLEAEKVLDVAAIIPPSWQVLRKKISGLVGSYLIGPLHSEFLR